MFTSGNASLRGCLHLAGNGNENEEIAEFNSRSSSANVVASFRKGKLKKALLSSFLISEEDLDLTTKKKKKSFYYKTHYTGVHVLQYYT